ncbi:MAG: phosphopyruvate hydratase [archaeon]
MAHNIKKIHAREILDSRGYPTVECEVTANSFSARIAVPSGSSTGIHEAHELRDDDKKRYIGKGVLKAVDNVNKRIAPMLQGTDCTKQGQIDQSMIGLDATENKSSLGANAILSVSASVCRTAAGCKKIPLYMYIADMVGVKKFIMPVPLMVVLEGGKHGDDSTDFQEFMIAPVGAPNFREALRWGTEVYLQLSKVLKSFRHHTNVGMEGAFAPHMKTNREPLDLITTAIKHAGYKPGRDVAIALDPAASEFYEEGAYILSKESKFLNPAEMVGYYAALVSRYPIISIEDGLAEDDWEGWAGLNSRLGGRIQVMGDDLTVTNVKRFRKAIGLKAVNSILVKINQIGTISETIDVVTLAKKSKCTAVISHRSGETEDDFIADLVVGLGTGQCKFGAPCRSDRTAKYNQLLRIEEQLGKRAKYAGKDYRAWSR